MAGGSEPADDPDPPTTHRRSGWAGVGSAQGQRALVLWTIAALAIAIAVVYALYLARQALLLIYVSILLAIGFSPLVRLLEAQKMLPVGSRRLPRWLAILSIYVVFLSVVAGIALTVFPPLVRQAQEFGTHLPMIVERFQAYLMAHHIITQRVSFADIMQQAPSGTDAVNTLLTTFWGVFGGLFGVFTILILTFYLLLEADGFFNAFVRLFPRSRRPQVRAVSTQITRKVSGWLGGQLILATVIGITSSVGLGLLGVPYFYVLAVIAAVGELIPFIGPLLAAVPGIAVALTISWKLGIGVTLYYFAQQQFESNLLVPKLMERQVGLSAAGVIIALMIGGSLLGVIGAILSVPTAAILQAVFQELSPSEE